MLDFGDRSWPQIRDLDGWVALLPVGAIEAHGPHLPLATDGWIAEAMARHGAAKLRDSGVEALVLPAHHYTPATFAASFAGTVDTPPAVVQGVIRAVSAGAALAGAAMLVVVNAHFDPANVVAIREAVADLTESADSLTVLCFDLTRHRRAQRIGGEFVTGACHAGRYEGSLMLAIRPDLVDRESAEQLQPYPRSLAEAIREGATSFEELGGHDAYFGWPAEATEDEGRATLDLLAEMLAEDVLAALAAGRGSRDVPGDEGS